MIKWALEVNASYLLHGGKGKGFFGMEIKDKELAERVAQHQRQHETWREGEPVEGFLADGLPCVRYQSGNWWHYDTAKKVWF